MIYNFIRFKGLKYFNLKFNEMKTRLKTSLFFTGIALSLILISCDKNDDEAPTMVNFSAENAKLAAITDATVDGTLNIMENGYDENVTRSTMISLFSDCVQITLTSNGNGGTIVLDFGASCQLNNGATVSGIINLEYSAIVAGERTIDYTFEDYTYNGNGVSGGGQIVRTIANSNGNPQSTVNEEITVSFPGTSVTATRNGLRIAEWVEGVGSGTWLDNVYHIDGNWNTVFSNGFQRSGDVTQTLVRKLNCLYFVSGVIEVEQEGLTGSIDYGTGECDNTAMLTLNGQEFTIILN